jgi:hypothetical protein
MPIFETQPAIITINLSILRYSSYIYTPVYSKHWLDNIIVKITRLTFKEQWGILPYSGQKTFGQKTYQVVSQFAK